MSALSTREGLAGAIGRHAPTWDHDGHEFRLLCGCDDFEHWGTDRAQAEARFGAHVADTLLASGAVVDVTDLADDDELVERVTYLYRAGLGRPVKHVFRALAAALTERGGAA